MSQQHTIVWTDVPVNDLDRAIGFYSAVLGKEVKKEMAGPMELGILPHSDTSVAGCLVKGDDYKPSQQGLLVYFSVEGRLDDAVTEVSKNGGKVLVEKESLGPHGFRAVILDSEGNRVALHSH